MAVRPVRDRLVTFGLLVGASLVHLPLIHGLVAQDGRLAPVALSDGLLSMGLAWSAGCSLENRRRGTVRGIAMAGVGAPLVAMLPFFPVSFAPWEHALLILGSALSALGLYTLLRRGHAAPEG